MVKTMNDICHTCGQKVKQAHKEHLNKNLLTGLQAAAKSIMDSGGNNFDLHELFDQYSIYNNFQKLRYFGLVHHVRNQHGQTLRGHWLITRNGWSFLRGELEVHRWVKVRGNVIVERSPELISVRDVYRGSSAITTTFEYFDEDGQSVGFRPSLSSNNLKQRSLL